MMCRCYFFFDRVKEFRFSLRVAREMMNCKDHIPSGLWCYCYPKNAGEDAAGNQHLPLPGMFSDYYSTGGLFDMVWQQGGGMLEQPPAVSGHRLSPRFPPPMREPEVLPGPPSEHKMASWLSAIVRGDEEHARDSDEMMGTKDRAGDSSERRKAAAGGARRSHHREPHNLIEKRRRCKISERLKTLQQLVPGCDKSKSNHASTLDQTIQYIKLLQHQVKAMSAAAVRPATAVYRCPVVQPPPADGAPGVLGPPTMVPFGALLPWAHYLSPAVLVPAAAAGGASSVSH